MHLAVWSLIPTPGSYLEDQSLKNEEHIFAILIIALIFVFVNLIVDLSYVFLDPRVRMQ